MTPESAAPVELLVAGSTGRVAYAFYATDDRYAMAAAVAVHALRQYGMRADADAILLHHGVSDCLIHCLRDLGVHTLGVEPAWDTGPGYFQFSLTKLRVLQLVQYERVVFLDADSLPRASLDELFDGNWSEPIAAPRAYWLRPESIVTSALFSVRPSVSLWARACRHFPLAAEQRHYDMDILNLEFAAMIHALPDNYLCLNSEWENQWSPYYFGAPEESYEQVKVIHFTALGKPWSHAPDDIRRLRPKAHMHFYALWEEWWQRRDAIIEARPFSDRLELRRLTSESLIQHRVRR